MPALGRTGPSVWVVQRREGDETLNGANLRKTKERVTNSSSQLGRLPSSRCPLSLGNVVDHQITSPEAPNKQK